MQPGSTRCPQLSYGQVLTAIEEPGAKHNLETNRANCSSRIVHATEQRVPNNSGGNASGLRILARSPKSRQLVLRSMNLASRVAIGYKTPKFWERASHRELPWPTKETGTSMNMQAPFIELIQNEQPSHSTALVHRQRQAPLRLLQAHPAGWPPGVRLAWAAFGVLAGVALALAGVVVALVCLLLKRPGEEALPALLRRPLPRRLPASRNLRNRRLQRPIGASIPRVTSCPCSGSWSAPKSAG